MNRFAFVALCVSAVMLAHAQARVELPTAPAPREVRPDGSRDPVPIAEPPMKGENPAVTVERIIKNSKDVGDKLEKNDTGTDTRKTQGKILSDIDALINQQENPPPQPDKNKDNKDDKQDKKDNKQDKNDKQVKKDNKQDKNDMGMPMKSDMPMGKGGMDQAPMPKDGMGMGGTGEQQPMPMGERRPRMGDPMGDSKKEPGGVKHPGKPDNENKSEASKEPKNSKDSNAKGSPSSNPMGKMNGKPGLPFEEEDASKDVWGHLPDKLRKQMSQYYKEEFTPKYAELLKLYYSSLADKNAKPAEPKK